MVDYEGLVANPLAQSLKTSASHGVRAVMNDINLPVITFAGLVAYGAAVGFAFLCMQVIGTGGVSNTTASPSDTVNSLFIR